MNCAEVYGWLQAYLDAGVTAEQERAVEAHIRACPDCRRRLVELARAVNALERTGNVSPRADFTRRLYEALEREAGRELAPKPVAEAAPDKDRLAIRLPLKRTPRPRRALLALLLGFAQELRAWWSPRRRG